MLGDGLKVLVVGGGGREHALAWKIAQSPRVAELFAAPGNAGIAQCAECVPIKATDITGLADFAEQRQVDLTVVGPESPLIAGIVDEFRSRGLMVFGPTAAAAKLEGSKAFAKEILRAAGAPTAGSEVFTDPDAASARIKAHFSESDRPIVVKADGEAAGKGVFICGRLSEGLHAIKTIMVDRAFGASGERAVVEEYLEGEEATLMALVSGETVVPMPSSQDYKRAYDDDRGPNTGGMGCYAPVPRVEREAIWDRALETIVRPTLRVLRERGIAYQGVLYTGAVLTSDGPKVLEFNCRFGDPETQVVLPLMETDLVDVIEMIVENRLDAANVKWYNRKAVCVVVASGGYPGEYQTGFPILGLDGAAARGAIVFHAGTALKNGQVVTSGGRVLGITAVADHYRGAMETAYSAVREISFEKMEYRSDIGGRLL